VSSLHCLELVIALDLQLSLGSNTQPREREQTTVCPKRADLHPRESGFVLLEKTIDLRGVLGICLLSLSSELHSGLFDALLVLHPQLPHLGRHLGLQTGDRLEMLRSLFIGLVLHALSLSGGLLQQPLLLCGELRLISEGQRGGENIFSLKGQLFDKFCVLLLDLLSL
jgi:hypothetical protein